MAWRSRNRSRQRIQIPLAKAFQCCIAIAIVVSLWLYYNSPVGRSSSSLKATSTNWDTGHRHSLPNKGWIKTHLSSAAARTSIRLQEPPCKPVPFHSNGNGNVNCIVLSEVGLDGLGARTTRMLVQHLMVASSTTARIDWCPIFSLTGWEIGNTAAYFRAVDNANVYCHAVRSVAGKYPTLLSNHWWNQLRCYNTPVEEWWSIWSNCTGVVRPKPAPPLAPSPFSSCAQSCHLNLHAESSDGRSWWNAALKVDAVNAVDAAQAHLEKPLPPPKRTPFQAVGAELQRIRQSLADAYSTSRKKWCGYDEENTLHVTIHVRAGDAPAYGGMSSMAKPIETVLQMIQALYQEFHSGVDDGHGRRHGRRHGQQYTNIKFHLHTETLALSPTTFTSTYIELGSRIVFNGHDSALIDGTIPIHVVLNAEATLVLECFRSTDVLILTSSSSFGHLGAYLSNTNRVVVSDAWLQSAKRFVEEERTKSRSGTDAAAVAAASVAAAKKQWKQPFHMFLDGATRRKVGVLAWCFASLGDKEIERFHGFTNRLDDADTVSFVLNGPKTNSNTVGHCPIELKGSHLKEPNRASIERIGRYKHLNDRQGPLSDVVGLFGRACKAEGGGLD